MFAGVMAYPRMKPRVSLFGNRDQCGIDDLPATCLQPLGSLVLLKPIKKLIDDTRLAEPLAEEGNGGDIGNSVHHSQPDKLLERAPVVDLELQLLNRKRKATPTLRLNNCCRTSILKRISGSIRFLTALLLRLWLQPCSSNGLKASQGIASDRVAEVGFFF